MSTTRPDPDTSPIFVIGTGRSGTTLLRLMLNAHPRIYLTHEAGFYVGSQLLPKKASGDDWLEIYLRSVSFSWLQMDAREVRRELARTHPGGLARDKMPAAYRAIMRCKARHHDKPRYGDKTPFHASYLARIFEDFPDARVVHILRDPRATVHSLMRMPWAPGSFILNNRYCRQIIKEVAPFKDRVHEVRLEDLLADPRGEMTKILEHVGEEWDDRVLDHVAHAPISDVPPYPWLLTATKSRDAAPSRGWRDELPAAWIRQIEHRCSVYFTEYGYERAELSSEPGLLARTGAVMADLPRATGFLFRFLPLVRKLTRREPPPVDEALRDLLSLNPKARQNYGDSEIPGHKKNYVGIACTMHDPAVAIVNSRGQVVFAEATERYLQNKRGISSPPVDVIRVERLVAEYCEPDADLVLARTWTDSKLPRQRIFRRFIDWSLRMRGKALARRAPKTRDGQVLPFPRADIGLARWMVESQANTIGRAFSDIRMGVHWRALKDFVTGQRAGDGPPAPAKIRPARRTYLADYDHHLTHAAMACYSSPFEDALCAVIDGWGEGSSTACYRWKNGRIDPIGGPQRSTVSLGGFYGVLCLACGFDPMRGEEWKVMGLAPYGQLDEEIMALLEPWVVVRGLRFTSELSLAQQRRMLGVLARFDRADLAHTGQKLFERRMYELLTNLAGHGDTRNLVIGGGCALNSSATGKYVGNTPFEQLHASCAPGDDGNALGAALHAFHRDHPGQAPDASASSPYLGSTLADETMEQMRSLGRVQGHSSWPGKIHEKAADLLADGKILGWVQGRAEFGPRALGNRSILADPRTPDIKERLNEHVKFREEFRPFAPSILHDYGDEYFESYQESRYMERTLRFREGVLDQIPGVVHVDGTGRLQTVKREWNERYFLLIEAFHQRTGVPVVLNTSFNVMGKPILHSVEDALAVFWTSGLDALVLGDDLIEK